MNLKKFFTIIALILGLVLLGIWAPWEGHDLTIARLFGVVKPVKYGELQVSSLKDTIKVYIDGEERGEVNPEGGVMSIPDIKAGSHIVKLTRAENPDSFYQYVSTLDFVDDFSVVLAYELGPSQAFSQGHTMYSKGNVKSVNSKGANLSVISDTADAEISVDNVVVGKTPLQSYELSLDQVHKLSIKKEGYETLEFSILPEKQEDRDKLKGVDLVVDAKLFWIPIEINK